MAHRPLCLVAVTSALLLSAFTSLSPAQQPAASANGPTLIDCSDPAAQSMVRNSNGKLTWTDGCLVFSVPANKGGTVVITPPAGKWDVSAYTRLNIDMGAAQGDELRLKVMARNPNAADWRNTAIGIMYLNKGQRATRPLHLLRKKTETKKYQQLQAFEHMNGMPGGLFTHWLSVDPANIIKITIGVHPQPYPQELHIYSIQAANPVVPGKLTEMGDDFFPFIDTYGQYRWDTWPGKITSDEDLKQSYEAEGKDLAANPAPADRDKWGGWTGGPRLEATGFFRTEKRDGQWWLVDPDGYLFWSHGVTGVGLKGASTRITGRVRYFMLPDKSSPLAQFQRDGEYDFTAANLFRALGPDWQSKYKDLSHRRLASWAMNTLGMWSQPDMMRQDRTPYTVAIHYGYDSIQNKLPDPYADNFRPNVRKSLERFADTAKDPWCIGYFVNNELNWGNPLEVGQSLIADPPDSAAKKQFVAQLRKRYETIEALNALLHTSFADWEAVQRNTQPVDMHPVNGECELFYTQLCEQYFTICREEVKRLAPDHLYLGCRFNHSNPLLLAAAAKYCDVVSYNLYEWSIGHKLEDDFDKPFISSEFHFGAQDRGMWGMGLRWASSQEDRAKLYRDYVHSALENRNCVGTHWFQYNSQAFTGRHDGENNQIGMTDIAGRPWPELRDAVRQVGRSMYQYRLAAQPAQK